MIVMIVGGTRGSTGVQGAKPLGRRGLRARSGLSGTQKNLDTLMDTEVKGNYAGDIETNCCSSSISSSLSSFISSCCIRLAV